MPAEAPVLNMGRRSGIQGLLSGPVYAARFRLDALINELLEPLEHILKKHRYLLGGEEPASLDFLAFGYLSLMLYPLLPQAWLQKAMYDRFPCVVDYIKHMRKDAITLEDTNPSNVWAISQDDGDRGIRSTVTNLRSHLPWRPIQRRPLSFAVTTIARKVASVVPFVSIVHKEEPHIQNDTSTASRVVSSRLPSQSSVDVLMGISAAIVAALAAMAIQHRRSPREGNLIFWALRPQAQGLGEARNLLSVLAGQMSMPVGL
jgi:sorting and assembly machinery component 37